MLSIDINHMAKSGKKVPTLGGKKSFFYNLGSKLKRVYELGSKVVRNVSGSINKGIHSLSRKIGLEKIAKLIGDKMRIAGNKALSFLPPESRNIVKGLWDMTPVGQVMNTALYSADVLGGRKDLSDEVIVKIFPEYGKIKANIEAFAPLADKGKLKDVARQQATQMAIAIFKSQMGQPAQTAQ